MIVAKWSKESEYLYEGANAQRCAEEIQTLGESVKAKDVLDLARNKKSELHKCFEWDDSVAAEKYRLQQARRVIVDLVIEVREQEEEKPKELRVFYKIPQEGYKPLEVIVRNKDNYQELLEQAKAELRNFKNKYSMLKELQNIFELID